MTSSSESEMVQRAPILLIHGAFTDNRFWSPFRSQLAEDRRIWLPRLSGYYPDEIVAPDFGAEQHVRELERFIKSRGRPLSVIGHSRGGRLALELARRIPELIQRLILAEPGGIMEDDFLPGGWSGGASSELVQAALALLAHGRRESAARMYIDAGHEAGTFDAMPEVVQTAAADNAHTLVGMVRDVSVPLSRKIARDITAPTLLLYGDRSPAIYRQVINVLMDEMPCARAASVGATDHFFPAHLTSNFISEVEGFLMEV